MSRHKGCKRSHKWPDDCLPIEVDPRTSIRVIKRHCIKCGQVQYIKQQWNGSFWGFFRLESSERKITL